MKYVISLLLLMGTTHQKHFPENPRAVIRYGCVVQGIGQNVWKTHVWAQLGEDVNCSDELVHHQMTGREIDSRCYVFELAVTAKRKEGLSLCNSWMNDLHDEMVRLERKK
jgi:hypothetical protein